MWVAPRVRLAERRRRGSVPAERRAANNPGGFGNSMTPCRTAAQQKMATSGCAAEARAVPLGVTAGVTARPSPCCPIMQPIVTRRLGGSS